MARSHAPRLVRFGLTGLAGFLLDFGLLVLIHGRLGAPLIPATLLAYGLGGAVHYLLTRYWVFPETAPGGEVARVGRYLALGVVNAIATVAIVSGLVAVGVDYRVAKTIAVAALFLSNYVLTPRLVMTSPGRRTTAPSSSARSRNVR